MCDRAIYGPEEESILFDFFTKFGHHGNVRHGQKKVVQMAESGVVGWVISFPYLPSLLAARLNCWAIRVELCSPGFAANVDPSFVFSRLSGGGQELSLSNPSHRARRMIWIRCTPAARLARCKCMMVDGSSRRS